MTHHACRPITFPSGTVSRKSAAEKPDEAQSDLLRADASVALNNSMPVDGRDPFRTRLNPWLKPVLVGIYRGSESETRVSERWCEMDFVHPQYVPLKESIKEVPSSDRRMSMGEKAILLWWVEFMYKGEPFAKITKRDWATGTLVGNPSAFALRSFPLSIIVEALEFRKTCGGTSPLRGVV